MRKRVLILMTTFLSILAIVTVSCAPAEPSAPPSTSEGEGTPPAGESEAAVGWDEPYKIGASFSLTGANALTALSAQIGTEIAVDQINAQGGILGRPVELVVRDDKLDTDEASRNARELHLSENVDAMILPHSGVVQNPMLRYCKENNILAFGAQGHDHFYLSDNMYPYYFVMGPTAFQEGFGLAKYVADWAEMETYVTICPDYEWGHSNAESFNALVKKLRPDIELVGSFWPPLEEVEFGSYVTGILATEADLVVSWLWGTPFAAFTRQAKSYNMLDQIHMTAWSYADPVTEAKSDLPSGLTVEFDNEYWGNQKNQNPYYEQFEKEYLARRGWPASLGGCQMYDIVMTLMQGIDKANSFDKDDVARAIEGSTFMTLRGPLFMRPINHSYVAPVYFGVTEYDPELGYCNVVNVREIPGGEVMLSDEEYLKYRQDNNVTFKPWHENWATEFLWCED